MKGELVAAAAPTLVVKMPSTRRTVVGTLSNPFLVTVQSVTPSVEGQEVKILKKLTTAVKSVALRFFGFF